MLFIPSRTVDTADRVSDEGEQGGDALLFLSSLHTNYRSVKI